MRLSCLPPIAALLLAAGCAAGAGPAGSSAGSPAGSAAAHADLTEAVAALAAGNYTYARTDSDSPGSTVGARVHLPGSALVEVGHTRYLRTGGKHYLRQNLWGDQAGEARAKTDATLADPDAPREELAVARFYRDNWAILAGETWTVIDPGRLSGAGLPTLPSAAQPDVTGVGALAGAAVTAARSGDTITGTLDATAVPDGGTLLRADPVDYFFGPQAKALPFTATLDAQGRVTRFVVQTPEPSGHSEAPDPGAAPEPMARTITITVSAYGATGEEPAPTGARPMPAHLYEFLDSVND